jgi:hypothetical protein
MCLIAIVSHLLCDKGKTNQQFYVSYSVLKIMGFYMGKFIKTAPFRDIFIS